MEFIEQWRIVHTQTGIKPPQNGNKNQTPKAANLILPQDQVEGLKGALNEPRHPEQYSAHRVSPKGHAM